MAGGIQMPAALNSWMLFLVRSRRRGGGKRQHRKLKKLAGVLSFTLPLPVVCGSNLRTPPVLAFGLWDIAYRWLTLFVGWPRSPVDWDLVFLIPVPR